MAGLSAQSSSHPPICLKPNKTKNLKTKKTQMQHTKSVCLVPCNVLYYNTLCLVCTCSCRAMSISVLCSVTNHVKMNKNSITANCKCILQGYKWLHLFVGGGEKGEEQIGQGNRVNESLNPLDGSALCHDVELSWWSITRPTLQMRERYF